MRLRSVNEEKKTCELRLLGLGFRNMDSPERTEIGPTSSAVQDSPFFNYLSSLSPIKAFKVSHIAQGFSELSIPTPPPVFTSPRINPPRGTDILKRPDTEKFSIEYDDRGKILKGGPNASGGSISQSMVELSPCAQKECNNKEARQSLPCSPLGGIEEYLADPVEGADVSDSPKSCLKQNIDLLQESRGGCTSPKETIGKIDDDDDAGKNTETEVAATLASSDQVEEDPVGENSLGHVQQVAPEGNAKLDSCTVQHIDEKLTKNGNYLIEVDLSMEPASDTRVDKHLVDHTAVKNLASHMSGDEELEISSCGKEKPECPSDLGSDGIQNVRMQLAEGGQVSGWDFSQGSVSESFHIVAGDGDHNEKSVAITNGSVENQLPHDCKEASQHQRGMRRRLQFEAAEAHRKTNGNRGTSSNPVTNARSPASPVDLGTLNASHAESIVNSSNHQSVDFAQDSSSRLSLCPYKMPETLCDKVDKSTQNKGISRITAAMPSGIGLHLNSIGNAGAMSCSSNVKSAEKDYLSVQEKSISLSNHQLTEDSESCLVSTSLSVISMSSDSPLDCSVVKNTEEDQQDAMKPSNDFMPLMIIERHMTPCEKKRSASQDSCSVEEFSQMSPRKKRKREPNTSENEGCKRCNCKKSKCLKLYCDCFAAGVYCAEPCACLDCFNKPGYEDTVLGTRQQIESRNPLAFAPKVVRRVAESPSNSVEDSSWVTPASARHKRGCNCKKSMCLKKYCECYQAGVGCAEGCRCEGCKNIFGTKGRSIETTERIYRRVEDDEWEKEISAGKLDGYEVRRDTLRPEQCHQQNLSPLTPLFQSSNHGRDASEYQLPTRRYLPSPESDISVLSSYGRTLRSSGNLDSNNRRTKAIVGNSNIVPNDQEMDFHDVRKVDEFSPGWGLVDLCDLTPLPLPPPKTASVASESKGCMNVSRVPHMSHGSSRHLSVGSLRWRGSPVTPIPLCSGTKLSSGSDSESVLYNIPEDDTPEILKDTHTPIKTVKASSPNQKRVSPPYDCLHELRRSSSSPGLKSGRKFILKSVPSFPPLTPCNDQKDSEK